MSSLRAALLASPALALLFSLSAHGEGLRTDLHGDPLPDGALARLGTARLRHGGSVQALAFAPDGNLLASGGTDKTIRLWDAATGKAVRTIRQEGWVYSLAFAPDGRTVASGG